jgi:hypothetical protein
MKPNNPGVISLNLSLLTATDATSVFQGKLEHTSVHFLKIK